MLALTEKDRVKFGGNKEPRCPCILLVDTSSSMGGGPIDELNRGLKEFQKDLSRDPVASKRVEVAIVTFDSDVVVIQDFTTAMDFDPPTLAVGGLTRMGTGILKAFDLIAEEKAKYSATGVQYYRPWIFLITDGEPQGEPDSVVLKATKRVHSEDNNEKRGAAFFAVGVEGADMQKLSEISVRPPVKLHGLSFQQMFLWLSSSMQKMSAEKPGVGEQAPLPALGWGSVSGG